MPSSMKEYGSIGQRRYAGIFSEEFLKELQGKRGIEVYREMSENDDVCGAILYVIETLIRQSTWSIQAGGKTAKDEECKEFWRAAWTTCRTRGPTRFPKSCPS